MTMGEAAPSEAAGSDTTGSKDPLAQARRHWPDARDTGHAPDALAVGFRACPVELPP
jgi:hypothetical protein